MSVKKNLPDFEFVCESYGRFTEGPPSYVFGRLKTTRIQGYERSRIRGRVRWVGGSESDTWPGPKVTAILRKARKIGVFVGENKLFFFVYSKEKRNL